MYHGVSASLRHKLKRLVQPGDPELALPFREKHFDGASSMLLSPQSHVSPNYVDYHWRFALRRVKIIMVREISPVLLRFQMVLCNDWYQAARAVQRKQSDRDLHRPTIQPVGQKTG